MIDHPSVEKWDQFLDGQLAPGECQALEAHLEMCAECQRALDCQPLPSDALPLLPEQAPRDPAQRAVWMLPRSAEKVVPSVDPPGQPPSIPGGVAERGRSRYRSQRCHAQGGQGEVWLAVDTELHREVALKRLRERWRGNPEMQRRFHREAEITARLQHPGVVPVHDLVSDEDGQPCCVMRFIAGESLGDAIARFHEADRQSKRDPGERSLALRDLLNHFVAACKTVAYAHSRGVLHRDIKPANIMLGSYGETLVVDWGLATTLQRTAFEPTDGVEPRWPGLDEGSTPTLQGDVLGTPPYMSPEQAAGRWEELGPASDVYSLGATLYCLLTGQPPFRGERVLDRVRHGTFTRPRQVKPGVQRALEAVCFKAMALLPEDRYASALDLASELEHWLADEPVLAYREPLGARVARWSRRHKPLVTAAAVTVLLTGAAAVGGWVWLERDRATRQADHARQESETQIAVQAFLVEMTDHEQRGEWPQAKAALERAAVRLGSGGHEGLRQQIDQRRANLTLIARLNAVREQRCAINKETLDYDTASAPAAYKAAFQEYGLAVEEGDLETVAERIRTSILKEQLLAALDDWAEHSTDAVQRARLLAVARRADPHPWKNRFRDSAVRSDRAALARLAAQAPIADLSPSLLASLANQLRRNGADAIGLLRRSQTQYPDDFFLNCILGSSLHYQARRLSGAEATIMREEVIGFFRIARALRPRSSMATTCLGVALVECGKYAEAETVHRQSIELQPDNALSHSNLAASLTFLGKLDEAEKVARKAIRLNGAFAAARSVLGQVLLYQGKFLQAETACREALRMEPERIPALINLGAALREQGKLAEAEKVGRQAVGLRPNAAHARHQLAVTLFAQEKYGAAEEAYREAIRLNPDATDSHMQLGMVLQRQGNIWGALACFRRGLDLAAKGPNGRSSSDWYSQAARRTQEIERRLSQVLSGKVQAKDAEELLVAAHLAAHHRPRGRFLAASTLLLGALADHPEFAESSSLFLIARPRYFAACCAAMAARGEGDAAALSAEERNRWRRRAAAWLRQELDWWATQVSTGGPAKHAQVHSALTFWMGDGWLDGVRANRELADLSIAERKACQQLWTDVDTLLRKTRSATP